MKRIIIDISWISILAILVLICGYVIFARFEGSLINLEKTAVENNQIRQAQGLPVGSYLIFTTIEANTTNAWDMKIWRYRLGDKESELFYQHQVVSSSTRPLISRFSNESIRVNFSSASGEKINYLVHLNGQVIGPAENGQAIISPDREWLLVSPDENQSHLFLKNIRINKSFDITPTSTSHNLYKLLQWSENGDRVFFMNTLDAIYEFLPAPMQLNNIIKEINTKILSASVLRYNNIIWGISRSSVGDNIFIKYAGEELKSILAFTDKQISSAVLSPHADSIAFSLFGDDNIWLKDLSNSQANKQTLVGFGKALAWPERNNIIFSNESGLFVYNISLATSTILFNPAEFVNLVSWDFLDMLNI